ncbi:MAG: glycosyltransferase [Gammaproteobacteria bacterium]
MIWFLFAVLALLFFIYPYVIYPVILSLLPKKQIAIQSGEAVGVLKIALLFCAYNEEEVLPEKIENLSEIKTLLPEIQIYAYSDCSTDKTNEMLNSTCELLTPVISGVRTGKVVGMKKLVGMTDADILICTDANVICDPGGIKLLVNYFTDPGIGSVACTLHYIKAKDNHSDTEIARVGRFYWQMEEKIKKLESETGSMMGADGSLFAVRRQYYPDLPSHLVDDMGASLSPLFSGARCISAPDVHAYEWSVGSSTEEFERKKRIACGSYSTFRYLKSQILTLDWLDRFKFFSHKTMRWWGAYYLVLASVFLLIGGWQIGYPGMIALLLIGFVLLIWIAGRIGLPGFAAIYEILRAILATAFGVAESLHGKKYQKWTPAKTR